MCHTRINYYFYLTCHDHRLLRSDSICDNLPIWLFKGYRRNADNNGIDKTSRITDAVGFPIQLRRSLLVIIPMIKPKINIYLQMICWAIQQSHADRLRVTFVAQYNGHSHLKNG